jgi:hypothetical protein
MGDGPTRHTLPSFGVKARTRWGELVEELIEIPVEEKRDPSLFFSLDAPGMCLRIRDASSQGPARKCKMAEQKKQDGRAEAKGKWPQALGGTQGPICRV